MSEQQIGVVEASFHGGHTLKAIADSYRTLMQAVSEYVQNGIDGGANWIRVTVDRKKRDITIQDNGAGISTDDFKRFVTEICYSEKVRGKYGKYGRGMVSAYDKCALFTITSLPKGMQRGYFTWTFDTKKLMKEKTLLIPTLKRDDLCSIGRQPRHGESPVPWQTHVLIHQYSRDPVIGRISLDELCQRLSSNYAKALLERQIDLVVTLIEEDGHERSRKVRGAEFHGSPLPEVILSDPDAGDTVFRLFIAQNRKRGQIFISETEDPFRLPVSSFVDGARKHLSGEIVRALVGGVLEGSIVSEKGKLDPNREQFEDNAALIGICRVLKQWHEEVAVPLLNELEDDTRDERLKESWITVLQDTEALLKVAAFRYLRDVIGSFKRGTVGEGHADVGPLSRIVGKQDVSSTATTGGAGQAHGTPSPKPTGSSENPNPSVSGADPHHTADPEHMPFSVAIKGRRRRMSVRNDSLGLQVSHEAPEDSSKLYILDERDGILRVNTRHPQFAACEADDETLRRLQSKVIMEAVILASMPSQWRDLAEYYAEREREAFVYLMLQELRSKKRSQRISHSQRGKT